MTATQDAVEADRALKAKHRTMWALGDYPAVAADIVGDLGPILVEAGGCRPGRSRARRGGRLGQCRHPGGAGRRRRSSPAT